MVGNQERNPEKCKRLRADFRKIDKQRKTAIDTLNRVGDVLRNPDQTLTRLKRELTDIDRQIAQTTNDTVGGMVDRGRSRNRSDRRRSSGEAARGAAELATLKRERDRVVAEIREAESGRRSLEQQKKRLEKEVQQLTLESDQIGRELGRLNCVSETF